MTSQPVEANVVLTADNTQYDQAMVQSAQSTNNLGASIDSLGQKLSQLSKSAGKGLIGISVADIGMITGATAAWASYEKQMSRLKIQAELLTKTQSQQERVMADYSKSVKNLRTEYGMTTAEAAKLNETITKITGMRQTRQLTDMTKVFADMSKATGESSSGLSSSLLNLQKMMGSPINTKNTKQYADMFTQLSQSTQGTAQSLIDFTSQMAPMGEAMGMNIKQVAGFATAFTRAGQDSFVAANVFNKAAGDITNAVQTGGPQLTQYANIVGVTTKQFKALGADEQMLRIFESLNKQGTLATTTLQRLGLEGPRTQKAIAAMAAEPGGIRLALGQADEGTRSNAAEKGAEVAMKDVTEQFAKFGEDMKRIAASMATWFGPAVEALAGGFAKIADNVADVMEGPLGEFLQMVMAVVAPLTGGAGAMLLFAGALMKVAAAFLVWRNSMTLGMREGFKGGAGITSLPGGGFGARGSGMLGERGAQLATDPRSSWMQRGLYNVGQAGGSGLGNVTGVFREGYQSARLAADPSYVPGGRQGPGMFGQWYQRGRNFLTPGGWTPPPGQPTGPRSMLSYAAGGLGSAISSFVTPQFDQMRYSNPAARRTWLANEAPWARISDRVRLGTQMGQTGLEQATQKVLRSATTQIHQDPMLTNQERSEKLANIRQLREENAQRLKSARAAETATRETIAQTKAIQDQTKAAQTATVGARNLGTSLRGASAGMLGGIANAGRTGIGAIARSGMAPQLGAGLAMGGMAATGIESNTLMMGAMGTMIMPGWGTAIGAGVGAAVDMANANKKVSGSIEELKGQTDSLIESGVGYTDWAAGMKQTKEEMQTSKENWDQDSVGYWLGMPSTGEITGFFGATKSSIEGWFGRSQTEENESAAAGEAKRSATAEDVARAMAEATGTVIEGTQAQQLAQLDEFMSTTGAEKLGAANIDFEDLVTTKTNQSSSYQSLFDAVVAPGKASGLWDRLEAGGGVGADLVTSDLGQKSMQFQEDIPLLYEATDAIFNTAVDSGKSYLQIMKQVEQSQAKVGIENSAEYERLGIIGQRAQQALQFQAPQMGRAEQFQAQLDIGTMYEGIKATTGTDVAEKKQVQAQTIASVGDQLTFLRQALLAQDQYDISRARAEEDFQEQRAYQEHDFYLGRERAEEAFNRSKKRATADYYRSVRQANHDFDLQRRRQEQDYQHQQEIAAKQMAMSVYNIYERVEAKRTSSATWLLSNAQDQLDRMQEQSENLDKLRSLGMSDTAIQQFDFTNPQQAQQLARFITEATPQIIKQANQVAGTQRVAAAKDLTQDESSLQWQENERQHRLQVRRSITDFDTQMKRLRESFQRGMKQQNEDFKIMMDDQLEDYRTGVQRQEHAYGKSMDRQAADFNRMGKEMLMSNEKVLTESQERLTGAIGRQADQIGTSMEKLKRSTKPAAIKLMTELANIFGFDYTAPEGSGGGGGGGGGNGQGPLRGPSIMDSFRGPNPPTLHPSTSPTAGGSAGFHDGGLVPGWTPGRDTVKVDLSGGEAIMRPEWARKVGPQAIAAMNHKAKHGGFASGGVFWPVPGHTTGSYPGHDGVDINRGSGSDDLGDPIRAFRSGTITYVGTGHGYGEAIFERTAAGTVVYGHTSGQNVHAGQRVAAGQLIGQVGSTGNSSAPHLHFGIPGGTYSQAMALLAGAIVGGGGFGGFATSGGIDLSGVLKDRYAGAEAAAAGMSGVHPLKPGMISSIINRFAHRKIRRLKRRMGFAGGDDFTGGGMALGHQPNESMTNEQLVRVGANRYGWGDQWSQLRELVMHESGFNNTAQNPTSSAYGMFQFLDGTWAGVGGRKTSDPWKQTQYGLKYIANRYNDPRGAWDFWQDHNWYKDGSVFTGPQRIGVGENGPEAVIPLNARGADFMSDVMGSVMGGRNVAAAGGGMNIFNTRIDRSTNFTGPITVQANDPAELIGKLKARQRVMALSRPSLTGSAA